MVKESRASRYGRNKGKEIVRVIQTINEDKRNEYIEMFLEELNNYSFEPRKEGKPENSGCIRELENIKNVDIDSPVHYAKLVKECIHHCYQKRTSKLIYDSMLKEIQNNKW